MKLRPLILEATALADIQRVIAHAEVHRLSLQDTFDILGGRRSPPGDDPGFVCVVPVGYRCVYTIEQQEKGMCRHLSVSVLGEGAAPGEAAVLLLMQQFGLKFGFKFGAGGLEEMASVWTEVIGNGKIAVNVVQLLEP